MKFISIWWRNCYKWDFNNKPLNKQVQEFLSTKLTENVYQRLIDRIKLTFHHSPYSLKFLPDETLGSHSFMAWNSSIIANNLTLIDADIYCTVKPTEFLNQAWQSEEKKKLAKGIYRQTKRFNKVKKKKKFSFFNFFFFRSIA